MSHKQHELDAMEKHEKCFYYERGAFSEEGERGKHYCVPDGAQTLGDRWNMKQEIDPSDCENCQRYKCQFIGYPLTIEGIDTAPMEPWGVGLTPVRVRPTGDDRTYFGVLLGEFPRYTTVRFDRSTKRLDVKTACNPCIYIPELRKAVYGDESWWQRIKPEEDIRDITDETIQEQWYFKLIEQMRERREDRGVSGGSSR